MQRTSIYIIMLLALAACQKKEHELPTAKSNLQNDAIKRTLGPHLVGLNIEFAYAMGILPDKDKLASAQVEASIQGAAGTFLEHRSFYTNGSGVDIGVPVADPSSNNKNITAVVFNKDTAAATLRYYYVIPEEARGQTVSFTFTSRSSKGETAEYKMGPYTISKMDMKRLLPVADGKAMYISIEDMAIYDSAAAAARPDKIDLVYLYRSYTTSAFNHALVSPAADAAYRPDITLPAGVNRSTKIRKVFNLQDQHLAQMQFGIFIDDVDFDRLDLSDAPNYAINLRAEAGVWVQTADNKYKAYVYINSVSNPNKTAVISMKRYAL
jgi:hypothetical protein